MEINTNNCKKVFIIGGSGQIGSATIDTLSKKGYLITSLSLAPHEKKLPNVNYIIGDASSISDTELIKAMQNYDYLIIASGSKPDDIKTKPSINKFREENGELTSNILRIARLSHVKKSIVLSSYLNFFNRVLPKINLSCNSPYILSKLEEEQIALTFNSNKFQVAILELPYLIENGPTTVIPFVQIKSNLSSRNSLLIPPGGASFLTKQAVSEAIVGALENAEGGKKYPLCGVNITFKNLFELSMKYLKNENVKYILPTESTLKKQLKVLNKLDKIQKTECGINVLSNFDFFTKDLFLNNSEITEKLSYKLPNIKEIVKIFSKNFINLNDEN